MLNIGITMAQLEYFLLILIRMSALFILSPIFGRRNLPAVFKIGFAVFLTIIFINTVKVPEINFMANIYTYFLYILKELMVGLVIGYVTYVIMSALYLAGQMIDMQVGFGMVNVIDPMTNIQVPLTSNFYYMYTILIFLSLDGHFMIIRALFESFKVIPVEKLSVNTSVVLEITSIMRDMFSIGFRIAAPIIAAIFVTDVVLGVLSRTMPEMNVFMLGMPIKIVIGLLVIAVTFMVGVGITEGITTIMQKHIINFFDAFLT